jgi:hypothetical protein
MQVAISYQSGTGSVVSNSSLIPNPFLPSLEFYLKKKILSIRGKLEEV